MATKWDTIRDEWDLYIEAIGEQAESETRGNLIRRDREDEFRRKYGTWNVTRELFAEMNAATAYYYASEELIAFWERHPRQTLCEYAVSRGIYWTKVVRVARRAPAARAAAANRAANRSRRGFGLAA